MFRHRALLSCCCPPHQPASPSSSARGAVRPMLSEKRRESLDHMYELIGTHSAVKLCRWQKSMLRGQGGCYKHVFYNIKSHLCMEATPSLGCANKCVFCWRLNTNPTIKEWNFEVDEPRELVGKMLDAQERLIRQNKGLPGVTKERWEEAMRPAHCALSLVGEPIVYPRINEFLDELHRQRVSTFLVNNGQFPDQIKTLRPITQLYLSIDACDKKAMKLLDRPVFPDFWERHQRAIALFADRQERTVFRVTMIEGYNMCDDSIQRLAAMIRKGNAGLIELKQLTPTFQSRTTPLRMSNVPKWDRMIEFTHKLCEALSAGGDEYTVPCVHEHSHCILAARKAQYCANNKWFTWIDYDKFHKLVAADERETEQMDDNAEEPSTSKKSSRVSWTYADYLAPTPDWALLPVPGDIRGSTAALLASSGGSASSQAAIAGLGFDPEQTRVLSNKAKKARGLLQDDKPASESSKVTA